MVQLPATAAIEYVAACWVSGAGEIFVRGCFCPGGGLLPGEFFPGGLLPGAHLTGETFGRGIFVRGAFVRGAYARSPQVQCIYAPSRLSA